MSSSWAENSVWGVRNREKHFFLLLSVLNKPKKRRHASGEDGEEGEAAGEDEATASDTENDQNVDNRSAH